jgi:hypothetical protein
VWLADLSYIWTREGWLYLAALDMAIKCRWPLPGLMDQAQPGTPWSHSTLFLMNVEWSASLSTTVEFQLPILERRRHFSS